MTGPLAGEPRERRHDLAPGRRVGSFVIWWAVLMAFWVIIDDSIETDELLAGAGASALGALVAELVTYQAATRFRIQIGWLLPALLSSPAPS
jgi:multisubunit Na+/H+ antiporter MnhE subunit